MADHKMRTSSTKQTYDPEGIESSRQAVWAERGAFDTPELANGQTGVYVKPASPFTTGGLHMGHVRSYSIGDAYARFRRARGDAVLFSLGFDTFGLPSELGAIAHAELPADWIRRCADRMLDQMKRLGLSLDYSRVFYTSDPNLYQWSQWLFLALLDADLVYRATSMVDWCKNCQTTLAALQVEDGKCYRCGNETNLRRLPHWFLRMAAYVEENDRRLTGLSDWDDASLTSQRFLLGRIDGVEIELESVDGRTLTVFTPYGDSYEAARFVLLSPRHQEIERWITTVSAKRQFAELRSGGWERSARAAATVSLIDTGSSVIGQSGTELPVFVSPIVDARYGPTAVLGIPHVDKADATIAQRMQCNLNAIPQRTFGSEPRRKNSMRYRASDFPISRQRSWGTPIPIVHCGQCGPISVPREDLPVVLPPDIEPTRESNPLTDRADFLNVPCPKCGSLAERETDTLDCHFEALWKWIPACVPAEDRTKEMFEHPDLRKWLPVECNVVGSDIGSFVFDQRFLTKALRDIGPLSFLADGEPFSGSVMHEMVLRDGRKMSKHLGNTVDPDELVEEYGADAVRLAILYAAGPAKALNWNDGALQFAARFLKNLWIYTHNRLVAVAEAPDDPAAAADTLFMRERLGKWCDNGVRRVTAELEELQMHNAVRNVARLFERIRDYERRILRHRDRLSKEDFEALFEALALLAQLLAPFAPHTAEALLLALGWTDDSSLCDSWPSSSRDSISAPEVWPPR